jgi:hypothetical protein
VDLIVWYAEVLQLFSFKTRLRYDSVRNSEGATQSFSGVTIFKSKKWREHKWALQTRRALSRANR